MLNPTRRKRTFIVAVLSAAVAGAILYASQQSSSESLRTRRQLSLSLSQFTDPKSVTLKSDSPYGKVASAINADGTPREEFIPIDRESRKRCQIIYITGVEGATHHGFIPIIEALAKNQKDENGLEYDLDSNPSALKAGLFGWYRGSRIKQWGFKQTPEVDNDELVQRVVSESCPNDGRKHVLIEWASFPSGHEDDRRSYRIHRQHEWLSMTPEEIARSEDAISHPTSMKAFYQAYSPYVDIKFVVLHRSFMETIASHRDWDGGPEQHSNVLRGFMLLLRRFLDTHLYDLVDGRRLWSLVCVSNIMAKNYDDVNDVTVARNNVLSHLADFFGWPNGDCPHCFDDWYESTKDPLAVLGPDNSAIMKEHMKFLEGVWPPPGEEGIVEQQCAV